MPMPTRWERIGLGMWGSEVTNQPWLFPRSEFLRAALSDQRFYLASHFTCYPHCLEQMFHGVVRGWFLPFWSAQKSPLSRQVVGAPQVKELSYVSEPSTTLALIIGIIYCYLKSPYLFTCLSPASRIQTLSIPWTPWSQGPYLSYFISVPRKYPE